MRWVALALLALAAGCVVDEEPYYDRQAPPPVAVAGDPDGAAFVTTDAIVDPLPGVTVGYYVTYGAGGHWQVRWTCDSLASGFSCAFDGTVAATAGDALPNLTPYLLEHTDAVWYADDASTVIGYSAVATTAVDGFDFDAPPGAKVTFDLLVDGYRYWQFVFLPSGDPNVPGDLYAASPVYLPVTLLPSTP